MADATRLLIKSGTLIDGSGGDPVPNKLLVVEGTRITLVGEADGSMRPETPDDRVIDATGKVKYIHFISSFPEQARVITDALQQWRFKPYVSNGKALEVETGISFGIPPNKAVISGKHEPQLPPARKHDVT